MLNKFILSCVLGITISACQQSTQVQSPSSMANQEAPVNHQFQFHGTVKYIALEGGFFGIITDSGSKILPLNLDASVKQDGAEVAFSGDFENVATIQQWGKPFRISEFKLLKAGKNQDSRL